MSRMPPCNRMALVAFFFYAPQTEWFPSSGYCLRRLNAPAHGPHDASEALRRLLKKASLKSGDPSGGNRLRRQVSSLDQCLFSEKSAELLALSPLILMMCWRAESAMLPPSFKRF